MADRDATAPPSLRRGRTLVALASALMWGQLGCSSREAPSADDYVSAVTVEVHDKTKTILVVSWTQAIAAESTWLEFSFEDGQVSRSRPKPGTLGAHQDVVLGVPAETNVTVHIVNRDGGHDHETRAYTGTTGELPAGLPTPQIVGYDADGAAPERYLLGAVEDSIGTCGAPCYNIGTSWIYVMDRRGRIVWYYGDPSTNAASAYPRAARDGEYLWIDKRPTSFTDPRGALKLTLDGTYSEMVPFQISECFDVANDGSVLFDTNMGVLSELDPTGRLREIWNCPEQFGPAFDCFSNTVNYSPSTGTILLSFPKENTLAEIDRGSGMLVGQYGDAANSYAFSPSSWKLQYPHFPNLTPDGTLIVSQHMPEFSDTYQPVAGGHAFAEFKIDRENRTLVQTWLYDGGQEWPTYKGMAVRMDDGHTLVNYGSAGVIRELTPEQTSVFDVKFDIPGGEDFYNKMVGHNFFVDDLYALNGGPR